MNIILSEKNESQIDYWLSHLQQNIPIAKKYWKITTALNSKWKQTGETKFFIPHNKFLNARAIDYENIQDVLKKFYQINIAHTVYNNKTILEDNNIVTKNNTETQVTIIPESFEYFRDELELIVKPELNIPKPLPIPSDWQLKPKEKGAILTFQNGEIIYFNSLKDKKYRYFKCLWDNHCLEISSKKIFEYESGLKYETQKDMDWQKNKNINRIINSLKAEILNKFETNKCPLKIAIDKSNYKLVISPIFPN